jgi:probable F420-dependent oxidoreductase
VAELERHDPIFVGRRQDGGMKVRFAVAPGNQSADRVPLAALVDALESLGFDTVWLSDIPMSDITDPLVGLAFAAGRTERLRLGANLVPLGRNPMLLAKELAQLDRLSGGRVLLSLVPGIDQPGEREALGITNRGAQMDEVIPLLRAWWAGEAVTHHSERFDFTDVVVPSRPVQEPLEIWLGGIGPKALERIGRLADGWLGAAVGPTEAGVARRRIDEVAAEHGRTIDPEHHGLSIPYARTEIDAVTVAGLQRRNPGVDPADVFPVGRDQLRDLVRRLVDEGLSKFVLRPSGHVTSWEDELGWLADAVLDLQR